MICPCKDCEKKGCGNYHSQCQKYLMYVQEKRLASERERKEKTLTYNERGRKKWKEKTWWN